MDTVLEGGFADPILQSQAAFRAVMDALANPGTAQNLSAGHSIFRNMSPELVTIVLTLIDHDSSLWLDQSLRADAAVLQFLSFHTGAPLVSAPEKAAFALASAAGQLPPFARFNAGSQEYPDRSTTIVLAVPALSGGPQLELRGPGIAGHTHISPTGLPEDFVGQWAANRALFPRGIDLLLVADGQVMGLPRTTVITQGH